MEKFLKVIGWKRQSGRLDREEILFDIVIFILITGAVYVIYQVQ